MFSTATCVISHLHKDAVLLETLKITMIVSLIAQIAIKRLSDMIISYSTCNHNRRKRLHEQDDSEGIPSKKRKDTSSIPVQIGQALDDVLIKYNVDLTKFEQGRDEIFKALTRGISAIKPAILQRKNLQLKYMLLSS